MTFIPPTYRGMRVRFRCSSLFIELLVTERPALLGDRILGDPSVKGTFVFSRWEKLIVFVSFPKSSWRQAECTISEVARFSCHATISFLICEIMARGVKSVVNGRSAAALTSSPSTRLPPFRTQPINRLILGNFAHCQLARWEYAGNAHAQIVSSNNSPPLVPEFLAVYTGIVFCDYRRNRLVRMSR